MCINPTCERQIYLLCQLINCKGFTASGIFSSPSIVQFKQALLEFYVVPEQTIAVLGTISLTAPDQISVKTQDLTCFDVLNKRNDCEVRVSGKTFIITTKIALPAGTQFQYQISNAIDNPVSTQPTDSWSILTSAGESEDSGIILTATKGKIPLFQISPGSQVVGASTSVVLKWKGEHAIPKDSNFQIYIPKWNPNDPQISLQKTYIQGSVSCSPQTVLSSKMLCSYQNDTLTISGGVTDEISANTEISILVTGFKNPIDTGLVTGFTVTSMVRSKGVNYPIDSGLGQFQVTEFAQLSQGKLEVRYPENPEAGEVQHLDEMKLSFYLPVPLDQGCRVTVELPAQYNTQYITLVSSLQAFGYYREYSVSDSTLSVFSNQNSFTILACDAYKENDNIAVLYINQLKQYKYEKITSSIKVTIRTAEGDKVAEVQSGIGFLPLRGAIQVNGTADVPIVQTSTAINFSLLPQHFIYSGDVPQIVITFPNQVTVVSPSCTVQNVVISPDSPQITPSCIRVGQTFTIKDWLAEDYQPGTPIQFKVGDVQNPLSTDSVDGLQITIMAKGLYAIDDFEGRTPWQLGPGTFTSVQVDPGSYVAYRSENVYEVSFQPQHNIPINGYIKIQFPAEILVPDTSFSQSSCAAESGFPSIQITCQFSDYGGNNTSKYTLTLLNAFRRQRGQAQTTYVLSIPGIQNPIKIVPTSTFIFTTFTSDGFLIDNFEGGNIQMLTSAEIQDIELFPSSYVNSARSTYTFTMIPSVPVTANTFVMVTFPPQMSLPKTDAELNCNSTYENLISSVTCGIDKRDKALNNTVRVALTLTQTQINEFDKLGFSISGIINPPSTQTTDSLQVRIVDSSTFASINQKLRGITVTTNQPSIISKAKIQAESYQPGVSTKYLIDFYPEHAIQTQGGFLITIPPQIVMDKNAKFTIEAEVTGMVTDNAKLYSKVDQSARAIYIENVIQGENTFEPGLNKSITIAVSGLSTPFTNQPTDSFKVSSFDLINGIYYYFINAVNEGLFIKSLCSYPCNTCPLDEPDLCLSCFQSTGSKIGLPYLQLGTCVSECNFGRFYNSQTQTCDLCDPSCLQCTGAADQCTICGGLEFPFYLDNKCKSSCPSGFIDDLAANKCQKCAAPCDTCSNTITTCTSCDKNGTNPFFFLSECLSNCTPLISVQVGEECMQCNATCKTCEGTPDTCTSCAQHMKFDPLNNVCTAECQPDTQIYNPELETCDTCNDNCTTCQGDINKCTACKPGFVLNKDFTCQATCNNDKQTPVKQICETCDEPCYSCNVTVALCTSCLQAPTKYYLHKGFMCVQYCPAKYNITKDKLACEYIGLICPDLFRKDASGDKCIPIPFECAKGFELNEDLTACIPVPGSPVPFPFLIAAIFVSFLVLGSYLKEKFFTKVYTCLLSIIGGFEILMYLMMVGISANLEEWAICGLCSIGLVSLIIANITFCVFYTREVVAKDQIYAKWLYFFPKTKRMIPVTCLLLNFKCSKIIYSGFYGLESSMAKFGRPMEYYRVVRLCSYFSFIFVYGFIFIADILILAKIKWGSQLLILGIETILLQILVIVLTYLESRKPPAELLSVGSTQYTSINPRKRGEVKVKAGFDEFESDDYEEGIPDVDENMMIRSKEEHHQLEVKLRNLAFTKIIKQVQINCQVTDECNLLACMTKFDPSLLELRRCFSARGKTTADDDCSWQADGESDVEFVGEEDDQVFDKMRERRFSWPLLKKIQVEIPVEQFNAAIDNIKIADDEYLIDNCFTEVKRVIPGEVKKPKKMVSRRTQTYLRDLLQMEGYNQDNDSELSVIMDDEAEIDYTYACNIIQNVLDNVSGNEEDQDFQDQMHQEEKLHVDDQDVAFELADIMGEFEIDDLGNFIIIKAAGCQDLLDKRGRRVNRRGYLIDRFGNVINSQGNVIYKVLELDADDEIPAPFDHEVRHKSEQFQIKNEVPQIIQEIDTKHDIFDAQLIQHTDEDDIKNETNEDQVKGDSNDEDDDLDNLIDEITRQKLPKKRKQLRQKKIPFAVVDNHPPKRLGQNNTMSLYPIFGLDNEEQRKLAIIADNISSMTQKLAMDQGRRVLDSQSDLISQQLNKHQPNTVSHPEMQQDDRIMTRPQSVSVGQLNYRKQQRPQTGNVNINQRLQSKQTLMSAIRKDQSSLQRVYNNFDQLNNFEDQTPQEQSQKLENQRKSGQDKIEMSRITDIYLNKQITQPLPKQKTMSSKPFRPMMRQYEDDPSELNVDTVMDGVKYGASLAKDVSLVMADRVDQIQRSYINQSQLVTRHMGLPGVNQTTMMTTLPPRPPTTHQSADQISEVRQQTIQLKDFLPPHHNSRQNNWIQ